MGVDIIIVTWNAGAHVAACLGALRGFVGQVVIVDNGSQDGSLDAGRLGEHGLDLIILAAPGNLGFGRGCNLGAQAGDAQAILFLNPDTRISAEAVAALAQVLDRDPTIGAVGPALRDKSGRKHATCSAFPRTRDIVGRMIGLDRLGLVRPAFLDHPQAGPVDQVMGACLMVRRQAFAALGGFDPDYFLYFEEVDLERRLKALGLVTHYRPEIVAAHEGHGSSGAIPGPRLRYWLASRLIYARKALGRGPALAIAAMSLAVEPWTRAVALAASGRGAQVPGALAAHGRHAWDMMAILTQRMVP